MMLAGGGESGMGVEDLEIELLLEGVFHRFGYDFRGYQRRPLKRRLHDLMQSAGLATVSALQERVLHDPAAGDMLLRALGPRPAALFDDPAHFLALREAVGSHLRSCPTAKVWIAECASAEEAATIAILLTEEQVYDRARIFATVANESLLQEARCGGFALGRMQEYEDNYRRSGGRRTLAEYCEQDNGRAVFLPQLWKNITWAQYSLATDASFNEFELIVCRGRMDSFGAGLRRRTLQLFGDSLARFGLLSVDGQSELDAPPFVSLFRPLSAAGLYRRVA